LNKLYFWTIRSTDIMPNRLHFLRLSSVTAKLQVASIPQHHAMKAYGVVEGKLHVF